MSATRSRSSARRNIAACRTSRSKAAFDTFKGIKRRMEVKGIAGGVTVIDDFGHHPTAIRETLRRCACVTRRKKSGRCSSRAATRRAGMFFRTELAASFADADAVVVSEVARLEQISADERLNPEKLMARPQGCRQGSRVSAGRQRHRRAPGAARAGRRRGLRVQQRRLRRHPRQIARAAGQTVNGAVW